MELASLKRQEYIERVAVLKDHNAKWKSIYKELHDRCDLETGHSYKLMYNGMLETWTHRCTGCDNVKSNKNDS